MAAPTAVQQLAALQEQVVAQQAQIAALQAIVRTPATHQRRPVLPDIDKFDGTPYKWDTWRPMVKAKLRVDGAAIGDLCAQFYYVYFALESKVQAMVLPQLSAAEDDEVWDPQSILDQLARVCDNPNKLREAKDRLHAVRQGDDSLPAYVAKFERLLYEAKGHQWDDDRKISTFQYGLSTTIKNRLAQQLDLPSSYPAFLRTVQKLSSRSGTSPGYSLGQASHNSNALPRPPTPQRHGDPMDITNIELNQIDLSTLRVLDQPSVDKPLSPFAPKSILPRKQTAIRRQASPPPLYDARCYRCGSEDHFVVACSYQRSTSVGTTGKKVTIVAPWDPDETLSEHTYDRYLTSSDSDYADGEG